MNQLKMIQDKAVRSGYTVRGLFAAAGVAYSNWGRWERGETTPTGRILDRLMAVEPVVRRRG